MKLEFHPAVRQDFIEARDYYQTEGGPHLAERFESIRLTKHAADIALARDELAASPGACCLRASSLQFPLA